MTFDDLLRMIPKLSSKQLDTVEARIKALRSIQSMGNAPGAVSTPKAEEREEPDWLLEAIYYELVRRGLQPETSHRIKPASLVASYPADAAAVRDHIVKVAGRPLAAVERLALAGVAVRVLAEWLALAGMPLSLKGLLRNISKVPIALEDSFPGYQGALVLGMLVRRENEEASDGGDDGTNRSARNGADRSAAAGLGRPAGRRSGRDVPAG